MKTFTVYFEIYGKKMKVDIESYNEESAKEFVKNKIIFHKVESKEKKMFENDDVFNNLKNMFGI